MGQPQQLLHNGVLWEGKTSNKRHLFGGTSEVSHRLVATYAIYEMAIAKLFPFKSHPRTFLVATLMGNMQGREFWEM